jgi:hypothetical protein
LIDNINSRQDGGDLVFTGNGNAEIARFTGAGHFDVKKLKINGTTLANNTIHVDNSRTDDYTPDGSILYPYKSVQDAHDSITGSSSTNTFAILVALGLPYTGDLEISKDYVTIVGDSVSKGAGYTGTITITSQHFCLEKLHFNTGTEINLSLPGHFLFEIKDCRMSHATVNVTANGTTAEKADTWFQVTGAASTLWLVNTVNVSGVMGEVAILSGAYESNVFTATGSIFTGNAATLLTNTINIETGTTARVKAVSAKDNTINLKTGGTLYADITSLADDGNTLNNTGGTLYRVSDKQVLTAASLISSTMIYVDGNRADVYTENGSYVYPYKTISAAITAASSGDTIYIYPDTYTEDLTLKPGVNLIGQSKFSAYVVGTVTFDTAGTVYCEQIIFKTSGDGNTLNFAGTGIQNLQTLMCNFEHTSGDGHCVYWTNTNASSRMQHVDGNITQYVSSGGGTAFTSTSTAAGGIILQMATVQVLDDTDNVCVNHGGAVVWTHTSDALNGQFVTADTARFNFKDVALTTATVVSISHLSTNATPSAVLNCAVTTYRSGVSIDGVGALVFAAIIYGGTGVGGAATLNGGLGAIPLTMAPIRIRESALLPAGSVAAGQLGGTFEYDGTNLYFTAGTTRHTLSWT